MTLNYKLISLLILSIFIKSCGNYSFTGASIPEGTESFQVNFFENEAGNSMGSIFEPGLDRDFTIALQNILQNQTNLQLLSSDADLIYEGEIKEYRVSPMTSTSNLQASQNRLSVGINVRFINIKKEEDNFERRQRARDILKKVVSEITNVLFEKSVMNGKLTPKFSFRNSL